MGDPGPWGWVQLMEYVRVPLGRLSESLTVLPSFPWRLRQQGTISQLTPIRLQLCLGPTLLLVALRRDSTHWGPGPARTHLPAFVPAVPPFPRLSLLSARLGNTSGGTKSSSLLSAYYMLSTLRGFLLSPRCIDKKKRHKKVTNLPKNYTGSNRARVVSGQSGSRACSWK